MPYFGPVSRRILIQAFRDAGFDGPVPVGRHSIMTRGDVTVVIPNPHREDIDVSLLHRLLKQAGISRDDWENL
jgi:predicted RNA binding protein YcfA (HicA-like mRNA interferase family)